MPTLKKVLDTLRNITEPGQGKDIVSQGNVRDLRIDEGKVAFALQVVTTSREAMQQLRTECEQALRALEGVEEVEISMRVPRAAKEGAPSDGLEGVQNLIAVSSCKGGVGKSTVAAHLARALQRAGRSVGLLDADVYGPSAPTLFESPRPQVSAREQRVLPVDMDGLKVMSMGFLMGESPAILRGPIVSNYVQQVLRQCEWGALDYLIIDLPPGTGDIQLTLVQQASLDGAVIVTTPHTLSLVDVAKGILMFEKVNVPVLGVVENMSSFTCDGCGKLHYPFGRYAGALQKRFGIPSLAELPITPEFPNAANRESGSDFTAFTEMAQNVETALEEARKQPGAAPEIQPMPGAVHIKFTDGLEAMIPNHSLRCACPCAVCVDENSGERILDPAQVPENVKPEDMTQLGNYAVSFHWSDGHTTGIYSWDYLRTLAEQAVRSHQSPAG